MCCILLYNNDLSVLSVLHVIRDNIKLYGLNYSNYSQALWVWLAFQRLYLVWNFALQWMASSKLRIL